MKPVDTLQYEVNAEIFEYCYLHVSRKAAMQHAKEVCDREGLDRATLFEYIAKRIKVHEDADETEACCS